MRTRRTIRETAMRLFAEHGYDAVTIDQIAREADVGRSTFFLYFPSKEATITEPDPDDRAVWSEIRARQPEGKPLWTALVDIMVEGLRSMESSFEVKRRLLASDPGLAEALAKSTLWISGDLRTWVDERTPPEDLPVAHVQLHVANAAFQAAYDDWAAGESFEAFLARSEANLLFVARGAEHPPLPGS